MGNAHAPEISVVVCTRNRATALGRCLDAILAQSTARSFEVIVVDNGSTDGTAEVVASRARRASFLRGVVETSIGLSRARNRGALEARAPLLAYLDDDAAPLEGWLDAVVGTFEQTGAAAVGGPIRARFESPPPPPWFDDFHLGALSCIDRGPRRQQVDQFPYLLGANLSVRRLDLDALGGFDERLGRMGSSLLSGEDTDLCARLLALERPLVFEPDAAVDHWIPPQRLTHAFMWRRAYYTGRTRAAETRTQGRTGAVVPALLSKLAKLPIHVLVGAWASVFRRRELAAKRVWSACATVGFLVGIARGAEASR